MHNRLINNTISELAMEQTNVSALTSRQECAEAVARVIESAELHVAIFSQVLEPELLNHPEICNHLSVLARKNRHSGIRIIAQQTRSVATEGHCLIPLAQRLTTAIQIRVPATSELQHFSESWVIADDHSFCRINNVERFEGEVIEHNRLQVRTSLEFFDHAWENSEPDMHTRRLHI